MALQKEIWINTIQENLFKNNGFILRSVDHSQFVNNLTVHVPNAGANPTITKNRSSFPASITQRTDNDLTYTINQYSTAPILLTDIDSFQISYDKRQSLIGQHIEAIGDVFGNNTCYSWAPTAASRIVRTTGAASSDALALGATGTRKAVTLADIAKLKAILDNDGTPKEGRILLMPSDMYNANILAISDAYSQQVYGKAGLPDGVINRIHGFEIIDRATVVDYSGGTGTTQTLCSVDDSGTASNTGTTNNLGAIAYHPLFVAHAKKDPSVLYNAGSTGEGLPEYLGSIFAAVGYLGSSKLRSDYKGVCALVQG